MTLNNQITQMQQYIESQKNKIEALKGQLQNACNDIIEVQNLYSEQYRYNKVFIKQWNLRFADQQKHIDTIVEKQIQSMYYSLTMWEY